MPCASVAAVADQAAPVRVGVSVWTTVPPELEILTVTVVESLAALPAAPLSAGVVTLV